MTPAPNDYAVLLYLNDYEEFNSRKSICGLFTNKNGILSMGFISEISELDLK